MTKEKRVIVFEDHSWWDNPGCDCCDGALMECWNCVDASLVPHSVHSMEDAKASVATALGLIADDLEEEYRPKDIDRLLEKNNIEVVLEIDSYFHNTDEEE